MASFDETSLEDYASQFEQDIPESVNSESIPESTSEDSDLESYASQFEQDTAEDQAPIEDSEKDARRIAKKYGVDPEGLTRLAATGRGAAGGFLFDFDDEGEAALSALGSYLPGAEDTTYDAELEKVRNQQHALQELHPNYTWAVR